VACGRVERDVDRDRGSCRPEGLPAVVAGAQLVIFGPTVHVVTVRVSLEIVGAGFGAFRLGRDAYDFWRV
jgi:hypothetical protein